MNKNKYQYFFFYIIKMSELEYKKLEKIKKLYQCLGTDNKDRDVIESIINRMEQLEKELPKKVSNDDLNSLRYIIATSDINTPIPPNGKFPNDLKKVIDLSDITKIHFDDIFLKEDAIIQYNKIIEDKKNGILNTSYLYQQPIPNKTKRKNFWILRNYNYPTSRNNTVQKINLKNEEKSEMKQIINKYPNVKKNTLDPNKWGDELVYGLSSKEERQKLNYLNENDIKKIKNLLHRDDAAYEYNRLIQPKSNQNNEQLKGINNDTNYLSSNFNSPRMRTPLITNKKIRSNNIPPPYNPPTYTPPPFNPPH